MFFLVLQSGGKRDKIIVGHGAEENKADGGKAMIPGTMNTYEKYFATMNKWRHLLDKPLKFYTVTDYKAYRARQTEREAEEDGKRKDYSCFWGRTANKGI